MKRIEECCPEDLNGVKVYLLDENALGDNIADEKDKKFPKTITTQQAKAVVKELYNKKNRKYPELKGINIKIRVVDLKKGVIKNQINNG